MHLAPESRRHNSWFLVLVLICATLILGAGIASLQHSSNEPISSWNEVPLFKQQKYSYWRKQMSSTDRSARRAAELSVRSAGKEAVPLLRYLLRGDNESVRQQVEQILSSLGESAIPDITNMLSSDHPYVRMHAARLLAAMRSSQAETAEALAEVLSDREERVIMDAAYALANLREKRCPSNQCPYSGTTTSEPSCAVNGSGGSGCYWTRGE